MSIEFVRTHNYTKSVSLQIDSKQNYDTETQKEKENDAYTSELIICTHARFVYINDWKSHLVSTEDVYIMVAWIGYKNISDRFLFGNYVSLSFFFFTCDFLFYSLYTYINKNLKQVEIANWCVRMACIYGWSHTNTPLRWNNFS